MDHFNGKTAGSYIVPFALPLSLAVNPDFLVLTGQIWGRAGLFGGIAIGLAAGAYLVLISRYRPADLENHPGIRFFGMTVRTLATVFLSTGILVSSGFAFNEIFLYWFPNFGFAFLLLALAWGAQFLSRRAVHVLLAIFIAVPVSGLLVLTTAGMIRSGMDGSSIFHALPLARAFPRTGTLFLALFLFVGYDLGFQVRTPHQGKADGKSAAAAVLFMGILFVCWGLVMLGHIPQEKLSQTSIPHLIAARKIWGEPGRIIMGLTIIFGSLAAVHGLFTWIFHRASRFFERKIMPGKLNRPQTVITLLAVTIGLMMGAGLAGSKTLEILIRIILILWVLSHGLVFFISDRSAEDK